MKRYLIVLVFITFNLGIYSQGNGSALGNGALIQRPVPQLPYLSHFGVMWYGKVAHYNQTGFHLSTLEEFSEGMKITIISKGFTNEHLKMFNERGKLVIEKYKKSDYDALRNNCEHFAMEMVFGLKKSVQSEQSLVFIKSYWPTLRDDIIKKSPNSKFVIDAMDAYIQSLNIK